jgi:hypothetical protein
LPNNAGKPWTEVEDTSLLAEFDKGESIGTIALAHNRTKGAIASRLVRLGRISDRFQAYPIEVRD